MFLDLSYSSMQGLILLVALIFFGRAFRENWIKKGKNWIYKSWFFGLISSLSFLILALIPMKG
ncbi:hypothetical protein OA505_04415 [Alphaproteobacteria bacterium]|nr:hypothetical protein [Alphaproteobacteria bacterium]